MNKEDELINDIVKVACDDLGIDETKHLEQAYSKSSKLKNMVETLSDMPKESKRLLKRNFFQINANYDGYLFNKDSKQKQTKKEKLLLESEYYSVNKKENFKSYYEGLSSLYDQKSAEWLKGYVDLQILYSVLNSDQNNFMCPICQNFIGSVNDKDHFLPKSKFPTLSISRTNIVLVCSKCNGSGYKGNKTPKLPIVIPNKRDKTPIEDYFELNYIKKGTSRYLEMINGLNDNRGGSKEKPPFLCDVYPKNNLSEEEKVKVYNLINLYKVNKRLNNHEYYTALRNDISAVSKRVGRIMRDSPSKPLDSSRIDNIFVEEINNHKEELVDNDNNIFIKYRSKMIMDYYESHKEVFILNIMSRINNSL